MKKSFSNKDKYLKKIKQLKKYNKFYFQENSPKITDQEYDKLKKEIENLENEFNFSHQDSPSNSVGYTPAKNFKKIPHRIKMLSLSNAFNKDDLKNFEKRIVNYLNLKKNHQFEYSVEPKIDGISASLTYKFGKFEKGLSRGNGEEGEDITENLRTIKDIPAEIKNSDFPEDIDIRGEVFIQNDDFENIKSEFANPRNAASGSLRQKDPKKTSLIPLKFIAYTFGFISKNKIKNQSEYLEKLKIWGFKTSDLNKKISKIDELIAYHSEIEKRRYQLKYDLDGIVYKINDLNLQKRLGNVANAPRWAIAHKFSASSSVSIIQDIDIQVGRTGALTPVAKINPVNIGGVVVSNATLHNEEEIIRKDIRIGDTVKIERAGDVIPHVISVDIKKREKKSKKFIFPKNCPSCGSNTAKEFNQQTKKYEAVRRCTSEGFVCDKIAIERLKHFVSKDALNIEGLGKKVIEQFWVLKFIKYPFDIFSLDYKKISNLDGWGDLSVKNLRNSIEKAKFIKLEKFVFSLGIRHIGQENAKLIAENVKKANSFFDLKNKDLIKELVYIDGIGETQINSLLNFFSNNINLMVIEKLIKVLNIQDYNRTNTKGKLNKKTFMFTGKLEDMSRAEAKNLVENNGGKVISSLSNKLNFLIVGEKPTNRKVELAKKNNIKLIKLNDFKKMLN